MHTQCLAGRLVGRRSVAGWTVPRRALPACNRGRAARRSTSRAACTPGGVGERLVGVAPCSQSCAVRVGCGGGCCSHVITIPPLPPLFVVPLSSLHHRFSMSVHVIVQPPAAAVVPCAAACCLHRALSPFRITKTSTTVLTGIDPSIFSRRVHPPLSLLRP